MLGATRMTTAADARLAARADEVVSRECSPVVLFARPQDSKAEYCDLPVELSEDTALGLAAVMIGPCRLAGSGERGHG